jgi:WD40 repeat protein
VAAWSFALADASEETRAPTTTRLAFGRAHARGGVRATVFLTVDADVLASASEDKTVRLWDLQTGSCLCALVGARAAAESVAFSPDAAFLFAGVADGLFRGVARRVG